jgi:polygalacturonase
VVVRDSVVRDGAAGFTFGSETSGGFRNIEAYNIRVEDKVPVGILFKSAHTRGGWGENLRLHDFTMVGIPVVLRITMNWNPATAMPPFRPTSRIRRRTGRCWPRRCRRSRASPTSAT